MTIEPDFPVDMRPKGQVERFVAELAAAQHGVVAHWQLLDLGLSRESIQRRVRAGRLHRIHRGVYAVGHTRLTPSGRRMAAVLACGPVAFLSHRTAAVHWNLLRASGNRLHVTVPATGRMDRYGIVLHQSEDVAEHATIHDGIPVTTVARTLLDLAADGDPLLDRAIEESEHLRLFDLAAIEAVITPGRRGVRRLDRALRIYRAAAGNERSQFERRVLAAIRAAGLPEPAVNVWLDGAERDLVWIDHKFVVELDGPWHDSTAAKIRDAQRDAVLQLEDWNVLRVAQQWFDTDPAGVVQTIRDFLSASRRSQRR